MLNVTMRALRRPPTPEVHSGDVSEPGPPSPTGLEEVLGLQHHPAHRSHAWAVIVFDGHTHQRAGAFTQVCTPRPEGAEKERSGEFRQAFSVGM